MRTLPFVVVFVALVGCKTQGTTPNPVSPPDTDLCGAMCDHLAVLGCEEGKPVYDSDRPGLAGVPNMSCTEFCQDQQAKGTYINPRCVLKVEKCADIEPARKLTCMP